MSDAQQVSESPAGDDDAGCQFPTGLDRRCGESIARSGSPGRPSRYCEDPEHTRAKAFAARRALERAGAGGPAEPDGVVVPERPVTDARASFGALLTRFEDATAETRRTAAAQQSQLAEILERATEVVRTVADPDAAGYEVEQIGREASVRVAEALSAQAAAEQEARDARRDAGREVELRAQADEAAEAALRELGVVRAEAAESIACLTAETQATVAEMQTLVAEHQRRAEQAGAELADANTATDRAQAAQAAAERRAGEDRAAVDQLRAELERHRVDHQELRSDYHQQLAELRAEIRQEREDMRRERAAHAEQLAAVLTTVRHGNHNEAEATAEPPASAGDPHSAG